MTETDQKPKQHKILKTVLVIIAIFVFFGLTSALEGGSKPTIPTTSASSDTSSSLTPARAPTTPGLNQPTNDGKFQFTVTGFACGQTYLVNDNQFENATAQGQFCVMKLSIKNVGSEAQQFDASSQHVYSSDGKQSSYTYEATMAANTSASQCYVYPTINPGNSLDCNVAFDVPKGVNPAYAELHDSAFSGGVKVTL